MDRHGLHGKKEGRVGLPLFFQGVTTSRQVPLFRLETTIYEPLKGRYTVSMKDAIPTREYCLALMEKLGMWENIVRHSLVVEQVACCLAEVLLQAGEDLVLPEITAGALLHDITKTKSIRTRENHALTGRQLLEDLGYPRIGQIVGYHVLMPVRICSKEAVSAEEIVHYADKRVLHDSVVSLSERFKDLVGRYGRIPDARRRLQVLEDQSYHIEKKIFSRIDLIPEDIPEIVSE